MTDRAPSQGSLGSMIRRWADHDFDDLRRAAEAIVELQQSPGWAAIERVLTERTTQIFNGVILRPLDHNDYLSQSGEARGLKIAKDAPGVILAIYRDELEQRQQAADAKQPQG